jgi:hypothetical protein
MQFVAVQCIRKAWPMRPEKIDKQPIPALFLDQRGKSFAAM